jgi:hypothetical protein
VPTANSGNSNYKNAQASNNNSTDDYDNNLVDTDDNQDIDGHTLPVTDLLDNNESTPEITETGDTTDSVEGTSNIPKTFGVLMGILFVFGLSITGFGIKIKKSNKH